MIKKKEKQRIHQELWIWIEILNTLEVGSVLVYDFWTPPPPINFVHDHLFFSKFIIFFFCYLGLG